MARTKVDFSFGSLGFTVTNLSETIAEELGLSRDKKGVVVREVVPGSPAADKGLAVGDICGVMASVQLMMRRALQRI